MAANAFVRAESMKIQRTVAADVSRGMGLTISDRFA